MQHRALTLVTVLLAFGSPASAQRIGIYGDLGSTSFSIVAPQFDPTNLYVNVVNSGALSPPGLRGAEFSIVHGIGASDAILSVVANEAAHVALGDPLGIGCDIAFPTCQTGSSVNLYTVQVVVLDEQAMTDQVLTIAAHNAPGPNFPCPLLFECDDPVFTAVCVSGGSACINDASGHCVLAVEWRTWSRVKALYQ